VVSPEDVLSRVRADIAALRARQAVLRSRLLQKQREHDRLCALMTDFMGCDFRFLRSMAPSVLTERDQRASLVVLKHFELQRLVATREQLLDKLLG